MKTTLSWNEVATQICLEECVRQGLVHFFIAPGSRSTPLVLAACQNSKIQTYSHFDERSLGFLALGYAKATQHPVALITTSGSATANLLPALVEAHMSQTPLIVITADRPFELSANGANQAIDQRQLYSSFVGEVLDIPEVSDKTNLKSLLSKVGTSLVKSLRQKKSLHINWHFQEPLVPTAEGVDAATLPFDIQQWMQQSDAWIQSPQHISGSATFAPNSTSGLTSGSTSGSSPGCHLESSSPSSFASNVNLDFIKKSKKGLICAGSFLSPEEQNTLLKIAEKLKMPILWDVQNTSRFQVHSLNIPHYDLILNKLNIEADVILHFGGSLTSKSLNSWIESSPAQYVRIYPENENKDFLNKRKILIFSDYKYFLNYCPKMQEFSHLVSLLKPEAQKVEQFLKTEFAGDLSELTLAHHLLQETKDCNLFVGSSMPIRDLERFGSTGNVRIYSNRGASGIDGNLSTALGVAQASQIQTIAFVGDLTFLYDLNALAYISQLDSHFKILVVNNQGGGIFSFLPAVTLPPDIFKKHFQTSQTFDFQKCAALFNLKYFRIDTVENLKEGLHYDGHCVMELRSVTEKNVEQHRALTVKYKNLS